MADWRVGQKVVCIVGDEYWRARSWLERLKYLKSPANPVKGRVYTISAIELETDDDDFDVGLYLGEVSETWFHDAKAFPPVVLSESDISISIFTEILDRVNKRGKITEPAQ